jgi:hypothetical protein
MADDMALGMEGAPKLRFIPIYHAIEVIARDRDKRRKFVAGVLGCRGHGSPPAGVAAIMIHAPLPG